MAETTVSLVNRIELAGVPILLEAELASGQETSYLFLGETGPGHQIEIGKLVDELVPHFGHFELPEALRGLTIDNLRVSLDTGSKDFSLSFEVDAKHRARVVLRLAHDAGAYQADFSVRLRIGEGGPELDFEISAAKGQQVLLASLAGTGISLAVLLEEMLPGAALPSELDVQLEDAVLALLRRDGRTHLFLALELGVEADLRHLPLVGGCLPGDGPVGLEDLGILAASDDLDASGLADGLGAAAKLLPADGLVHRGLRLSANLELGGTTEPISLELGGDGGSNTGAVPPSGGTRGTKKTPGVDTPPAPPAAKDGAKWFNLQRRLGPVHLQRVGFQYHEGLAWLLLDGALSLGGLTMSLDGLGVGIELGHLTAVPHFHLQGATIDFGKGPLEIAGGLLKIGNEFDGLVVLRMDPLSLSALGSYAEIDGHHSIFIYGVLSYPLGGPGFCFVTGLAAGFGYNRSLSMPDAGQVENFPLVAVAMEESPQTADPATMLASLHEFVAPEAGENFLAVGIKFTSYDLIDSFAMLTVSFGERFELDLIGLSTVKVPPAEVSSETLAELQMGLVARFAPDEGFLGVSAVLTSESYILSRACRLTGGFAFSCWFAKKHAGEFVVTLGGYHPRFEVPEHFPRVPRLGIDWKLDEQASIKGQAYFALTSSALMAGGSLQATWQSDHLSAAFTASADFLISWQPFLYDIHLHIGLKVAYNRHTFLGTIHFSFDISADLHIWGPEFAGTASVDIGIVSFDVKFGDGAGATPLPISWDDFATHLPDTVCSITLSAGLLKTVERQDQPPLWVVNPKELVLATDSAVPVKKAKANGAALECPAKRFGIAPMDLAAEDLESELTIKLERLDLHGKWVPEQDFGLNALTKGVPAALWAEPAVPWGGAPDMAQRMIDGSVSGYEIRPLKPPHPGASRPIERGELSFSEERLTGAFDWQELDSWGGFLHSLPEEAGE